MRIKSTLMALGMVTGGAFVVALPATPAFASGCPDWGWTNGDGNTGEYFRSPDGARIRTGPSNSCSSVGTGYQADSVTLHCYKYGDDGRTWTHLRDDTQGVEGWVPDSMLEGRGSWVPC
jgi:hypothetical protein